MRGFVLGGILGLFGGGLVGTGLGAGAGIVTGMQAGACLTVEAAKDKGFIRADQVEQIFAAAAVLKDAPLQRLGTGTALEHNDDQASSAAASSASRRLHRSHTRYRPCT